MKLIDLLVKELPQLGGWPDGAEIAVQDSDSQICFSSHSDVYANKEKTDWYGGDWGNGCWDNPFIDTIADDRHECIVSRKQYEAALAASDDWIEWGGGDCPVDSDAIVEVRYRKPSPLNFNNDRAGDFSWLHDGFGGDIIAYRIQQHGINSRANDDRLEQDLNECIGQEVAPAWNGTGLPPVGCLVEVNSPRLGWTQATVTAVTDNWIIAKYSDGVEFSGCHRSMNSDGVFTDNPGLFRQLRTEAEKARESAINDIALLIGRGTFFQDAERIYDAIAAGKIPGVKLED